MASLSAGLLVSGCLDAGSGPVSELDRGKNALAEQRFDWARVHFRAALAHRPDNHEVLGGACLAWSSGGQQSLTEIIAHCQSYLEGFSSETDPTPSRPGRDQAILRLVDAWARSGAAEEARDWVARVGDPVLRSVVDAELWLDADPERALEALDAFWGAGDKLAPSLLARAHTTAGEAHRRLGRPDAARAAFERALDVQPLAARLHYRLGRLLLGAGERQASARLAERFRALERLATRVGPEAPSDVERLRILDGLDAGFPRDHPRVRAAEARWALTAGFVDRGSAVLDRLHAQGEMTDDERVELAELLVRHGRVARARAWLGPLLAEHPEHLRARVVLTAAELSEGDLEAVRALLEEGLRRAPRLARYHHLMARLLTAEGNADAADTERQLALALSPWNLTLRIEVADRLLARGERKAAERLVALAPEPSPQLDAYRQAKGLDGPS